MKLRKPYRSIMGFTSMLLGIALFGGGAFLDGESQLTGTTKTLAITGSVTSGAVLTFVVSRRLLTKPEG